MKGETMLSYSDVGKGEVIVFIHGLGQTKESWKSQFELSNTYRLITVDLRGHGNSETINENITLENMALDVIELMDHLHIESAYICGLSLGGLVAQEIYRQREDLVSGLILSNTTWYIPSYFANKIVKKSEKLFHEDKEQLIEYIVNVAIHNKEMFEESRQSFYLSNAYLDCALSGTGYNYFPTLLKVNIPTLLIGGLFDKTTPLWNLFVMKWLIPKADVVILDKCAHLSNIECKQEFNDCIRRFIGNHEIR
jgi:pimeloyl-ACP methyl ester carboxylesterase